MKKRNIMFITSIVLIVVLCFAATSALAVTRTNHYDSYTSTKASSSLSMRQCCSPGRLSSYLRTRGTQRLILNPGSSNGYVYSGATGGGWTVTTISDSVSVTNTNYGMVGSAHACYGECAKCNTSFGSKTSYH